MTDFRVFKIASAEVGIISQGDNIGKKFLKARLVPAVFDLADDGEEHTVLFFGDATIAAYEADPNHAAFKSIKGKTVTVELRPFTWNNSPAIIRTQASVFMLVKSDGSYKGTPEAEATRLVQQLGAFVGGTTASVVPAPPAAAPSTEPTAEEIAAFKAAQAAAANRVP